MDQVQELHRYDRKHDPARVLALSDGVFAIIITLLVLEIHVPDLAGGQTLRDAIVEIRPSFIGFLISFVVVAIFWAGHRDLFAHIRRTDRTMVWLNIVYLFPLSLLPFGAALISRFNREPVGVRLYGVVLVLIAVTRFGVWLYATNRQHLLFEPIGRRTRTVGAPIAAVPAGALRARDPHLGGRPHRQPGDPRRRSKEPFSGRAGAVDLEELKPGDARELVWRQIKPSVVGEGEAYERGLEGGPWSRPQRA